MFQSIYYAGLGTYDPIGKTYHYDYKLTDSEFGEVMVKIQTSIPTSLQCESIGVVIKEYGERKIDVAKNLIRFLRWSEKMYGHSIEMYIVWAEKGQPLFTPEIKEQLQKYLVLL